MSNANLAWLLAGAMLPSALVAWAATWVVRRFAVRWGLLDQPNARKVHVTPTPLGGGLAIWAGVIATFAAAQAVLWLATINPSVRAMMPEFARPHIDGLWDRADSLWTLLGAGTVLMIVGLMDDRRGLPWQLRLGIQFFVAAACVIGRGWQLTAFIDSTLITWTLSVLWIVMLVNSFNMLDNMDGLSGGVATIASLMLAAVLLMNPDPETRQPQLFVAGLLLVLAGSTCGFLWHNRPPARIFMGDAGSYFLGFTIAIATMLATFSGYHSSRPHTVLAPLCVMAVPLYDTVTVLWIRLSQGKSPFHADKNHFSHRLVELGLSKTQAVLTIYLTTATCGLGALLLHQVDTAGAVIIALLILCVLALIAILEMSARRKINA
ncbi:MAG: MraY family glycosyltransferase [Pirellulaceae bacterium]